MLSDHEYDFRDVTARDLKLIAQWLDQPHWRQWWGEPETELASIKAHMTSDEVEPLIVELDGKPIAYLQTYDPHLEDNHPYADQPFGTIGVDLSIGPADLLNKGHGAAILAQFCAILFEEGALRVIIDPHPDNKRAIASYEKAGFRAFDTRVSEYGPATMMAIDSPDISSGDTDDDEL